MSDYSSSDEARREAARKRLQERQARLNQTETSSNSLSGRMQSLRSSREDNRSDQSARPTRTRDRASQSVRSRFSRGKQEQSRVDYADAPLADDDFGYAEDVYADSYPESSGAYNGNDGYDRYEADSGYNDYDANADYDSYNGYNSFDGYDDSDSDDYDDYDEEPVKQARAQRPKRTSSVSSKSRESKAPRFNTENAAETLKSIGRFIAHYARIAGAAIAKGARFVAEHAVNLYHTLVERFGARNTNIGLAILAVLIILLIVLLRGCATPSDPSEAAFKSASRAVSSVSYSNDDGAKPDQDYLANFLGYDQAALLLDAASKNQDVYWIAAHPELYEEDGYAVEAKLFRLAATEPAAVSYVRNWPDRYPQETASGDATPTTDSGTAFPRLYQWDERWGYTVYSSTSFALTGCCPTALCMVYQGFSGDTSVTPFDVAMMARNNGYETQYDGTDGSFLVHMAGDLGLSCTELTPAATNLRTTLNAGQALIINVGPGDFTDNGHFIVATGLDSEGKVIINDPYSAERSNRTWDIDTLVSQAKAFYAYSAA